MAKSSRLRLADVRAIFELVGEVREFGHDPAAWRGHLLGGVQRLFGDVHALVGESRLQAEGPEFLALADSGWPGLKPRDTYDAWVRWIRAARPDECPPAVRLMGLAGATKTAARRRLVPDRDWYRSAFYTERVEPNGVADAVFSAHLFPDGLHVLNANRLAGARPFDDREVRRLNLLHAELGRHLGRGLATARDPAGRLPTHLREALGCLLEGDSEKQAGLRLGVTYATVRGYVQALYRHFGVATRAELMARFLRRGPGTCPPRSG